VAIPPFSGLLEFHQELCDREDKVFAFFWGLSADKSRNLGKLDVSQFLQSGFMLETDVDHREATSSHDFPSGGNSREHFDRPDAIRGRTDLLASPTILALFY
jgi:hypothetical protein